jgi:thiamine-monophosphate kinase
VVELSRVPLSKSLQRAWGIHKAARVRAATAGDDYEIAFTAPPRSREKIVEAARKSRTAVTEIGYVKAGWGVVLLGAGGKPIRVKRKGWEHF